MSAVTASIAIRRAEPDDYEAVAAFTAQIWDDRGGDYLSRVYHDWLEDPDDDSKKTVLAEVDGEAAGIVQAVMLSADEAWFQGLRVNPDFRRRGVSLALNEACFEWARERGATVGRLMIFAWNRPALGAARAGGFDPVTEFRFAHPTPDPDAEGPLPVIADSTPAWRYWTESDARAHLSGLSLSTDESWALQELCPDRLGALAEDTAVFAVDGEDGITGMGYRNRTYEREGDDGVTVCAEYGVGAWENVDDAAALFAAIARDAAECGADTTRVLIPETVETVSDAAYVGADIADHPDFVLGADLTGQ